MKRLKVRGKPVLNFFELQKNFYPRELLLNLEDFIGFARLHCLPLASHVNDRVAKHLTKHFWLEVLINKNNNKNINSAQEVLKSAVKEDNYDLWRDEIKDFNILSKLEFIKRSSKLDYCGSLKLLAIAELCEIDVRKSDASIWHKFSAGNIAGKSIKDFNDSNSTLELDAAQTHYKYYIYEQNKLLNNAVIKTVCIKNASKADINIELYNHEHELVQAVGLLPGEFRYVNSVCGRIVKFLPSLAVSDELCAARENYSSHDVKVYNKLNLLKILEFENISSFDVGDEKQGLLLVRNGKLDIDYCNLAEQSDKDYLAMFSQPVAEAAFCGDSYKILLANGDVIYNFKRIESEITSLTQAASPKVIGVNNYTEAAVSRSGESAAVLSRENLITCFKNGPHSHDFFIRKHLDNFIIELDENKLNK